MLFRSAFTAGTLRLDLAQFRELQAFVQFASDLDEETKAKIRRGEILTETLKQPDGAPMPIEEEVIVLYAATSGFVNDVPAEGQRTFLSELGSFVSANHRDDIMTPLRERGTLDDTMKEKLDDAIKRFMVSTG